MNNSTQAIISVVGAYRGGKSINAGKLAAKITAIILGIAFTNLFLELMFHSYVWIKPSNQNHQTRNKKVGLQIK